MKYNWAEWGSSPCRLRRQRLALQSQETKPLHHIYTEIKKRCLISYPWVLILCQKSLEWLSDLSLIYHEEFQAQISNTHTLFFSKLPTYRELGCFCCLTPRVSPEYLTAGHASAVSEDRYLHLSRYAGLIQQTNKLMSFFVFFFLFFFFSQKIGFDISCKLSPKETICMKCQIVFPKEKCFKMPSAVCFTQHLPVNLIMSSVLTMRQPMRAICIPYMLSGLYYHTV